MTELRHLQLAILTIMKDVDELCKKNNITYYLLGGSAIGAVRHKGFIPWDDDLDIMMSADNYENFINVCREQLDKEKYYLQVGLEDWPLNFTKVRLRGTEITEYEGYASHGENGIYLDIFKLENSPSGKFAQWMQYAFAKYFLCYQLSVRTFNSGGLKKRIMMFFSFPLKYELFRKMVQGFVEHYGNDSDNSSDAVNDSIIIDPEFYNEAIPLNNNPPMESVFCFKIINIYPFNTNISELEYSIEFKINSRMTADICVNLKALFDKEESLVSIGTDGRAKVDFTGEYNLYIPSQNVEHYTMVKVGLDGVLGGTIGMNLNLYLNGKNKDMYSLDCYNIINSYEIRNYIILQSEFDNINSNNFTIPWNETVKQNEIYYGIKQYYQINSNQKVEEQCIETTRKYISGTINETITQCE